MKDCLRKKLFIIDGEKDNLKRRQCTTERYTMALTNKIYQTASRKVT